MNEDRKKRGLAYSKLLTAVAIGSLLLSSGNVMAIPTMPSIVARRDGAITDNHSYRLGSGRYG